MLRLWYGTSMESHSKGFFNKIEIFDITDATIADNVRKILMNYNSEVKNGKIQLLQ